MSNRQGNSTIIKGTDDQVFTVGTSDNYLMAKEITVKVETMEEFFNGKIDKKRTIRVDTVEDWIQNAILTAFDNNITCKIELTVRSNNASSAQNATSVTANSKRGEQSKITAPSENVFERIIRYMC